VRVENPNNSFGAAVRLQPGADLVDSTILAGPTIAVDDDSAGGQHVVRDSFIAGSAGVSAQSGSWNLDRLEIAAKYTGVSSGTTTNLRNSLVRISGESGNPAVTQGLYQFGSGVLAADHVTIHGPSLTYGALAVRVGAGTATIDMKNSIVTGSFAASSFAREASGGGIANIVVGHSNFAPPGPSWVDAGHGPGVFQQTPNGTNTNLDPRFVDTLATLESPTVDSRLRHDSPLIDKGEPGGTQGQDLARETRLVGAARDMGAFEYQRQAPLAAFAGPDAVAAGQAALFDASASTDPDHGDEAGLSYSWDFGDGASASGKQATHAYAAGGAYTVTLTVTDPTGLSATASRQVAVAAPPAGGGGGSGGAGTAGGAGDTGAGGGAPAADATAPALSALRANASRRGAVVRFRLSEPAAVTLRFKRRGGRTAIWRVRGQAGLNRVSRQLRAGRWRLTAIAVDAAGNRSRPGSTRFRLPRR
jgi:PKD domain